MKIIDFHNHYYPPEYIESLRQGSSEITVSFDDEQNPVLHSPGDINVIVPGHRDIDFRQNVLDAVGIEMQVLTFTAPGTVVEPAERSVALARTVNDAFATIVRERPDRFSSLATLPLNDPEASRREVDRALDELGFKGFMLFSNVNGKALYDEAFWPLYERANDADAVMYIHPTYPLGVEAMKDFWLMPLVGFLMDTTLAAAGLVFKGVVERFPRIRWVLCHLGGAVPYLAERFDRGYEAFAECRGNITKPPSAYLEQFYYDTVNFDTGCLELAIKFAGVERILAGSDYPHQIGSLQKMLASIEALDLSDVDREKILNGNAARLLGI